MGYCIPGTLTSPLPPSNPTHTKSLRYTLSASIQRNQIPLVGRRLIRISTAEGKWQGNWNADYNFSLRDLRLDDLVEDDDPNDARVFVSLSIHRETCSDFCEKSELGLRPDLFEAQKIDSSTAAIFKNRRIILFCGTMGDLPAPSFRLQCYDVKKLDGDNLILCTALLMLQVDDVNLEKVV
ncbi:hypothetical protein Ccrd_002138 [Cynara cardunculus var. scolymus]|uniref:Uncharacterized protein n=1 Tax=Cynara cardunculus var. scolymus TaxID=59895 RepID=A0A103XRZ6_CYNCS|nr:hypothetical protein Ccrd_002138 [Cynara cardunculus var. scolymus]